MQELSKFNFKRNVLEKKYKSIINNNFPFIDSFHLQVLHWVIYI